MSAVLTPGAYLRRRREAAGIDIHDVAALLVTVPRIAEHVRVEWIDGIERDVIPARFATIVGLRCAYRFDLDVLAQLATIALGAQIPPPQLCRVCACSELDACDDVCHWVEPDLCSSCALPPAPAAAIAA